MLGILSLFDDDDSEPYYVGAAAGGDGTSTPLFDERRGFLPYPYADGRAGYMRREVDGKTLPADTRDAVFRLGAEGAYLYDDVWRSSAQFRLMAPRFYAQFRYDFFLEGPTPVVEGDLELQGTVRDRLHFASFELGPQIFASERLAIQLGVMGTVMFDDRRSLPEDPTTIPGAGAVGSTRTPCGHWCCRGAGPSSPSARRSCSKREARWVCRSTASRSTPGTTIGRSATSTSEDRRRESPFASDWSYRSTVSSPSNSSSVARRSRPIASPPWTSTGIENNACLAAACCRSTKSTNRRSALSAWFPEVT